ncbi:MAG: UDP-N-acetylmuramoyl-L-alanine--D-glutamate ligase [Kiritimatiellae bacterium]|nr:UDP-N-acetylmuramoyl-L-alanine--D-glutamate ligase [Kiritimatiellia bacterium]
MTTYRNALVLGLGVSGAAAAELLLADGVSVVVADRSTDEAVEERARALRAAGADVVTGAKEWPEGMYNLCVVSPGLPVDSGWIAEVAERGVPVISELELAYEYCPCPVIAITGTNGKSTLTRLCGDILEKAGKRVAIGGNYGTPACTTVREAGPDDWLVWEVSSFQLETCLTFAPRVGVILNIQPDHLDRHGSLARYAELKVSMLTRMEPDGVAVVPALQRDWMTAAVSNPVAWETFGLGDEADYIYRDGELVHGADRVPVAGTYFDNPITGQTAAAAWAVAAACGVAASHVGEAIAAFTPLPHRMQQVSVQQDVTFVDDSKATNLAAMKAGLRMAGGPVRLIAGGRAKGEDLESVKEVLANGVRSVYLVGEAAQSMQTAWGKVVTCRMCGTMEQAVKAAAADAASGEWVLLSPGCASFDQYPNYKVRGDDFAELVNKLET